MYGQGSGILSNGATATSGAASTAAGIAILPNTGDSLILGILSLATITVGSLILVSFAVTRLMTKLYSK